MTAAPFTTLELVARAGGRRFVPRAEQVLARGPFLERQLVGGTLLATMRGDAHPLYRVSLARDLTGECDCPHFQSGRTQFCKHLLALGLDWLARAPQEGKADDSPALSPAGAESIRFSSFEAEHIYAGLLEGSPAYYSLHLLQKLKNELLGDEENSGLALLAPTKIPFPPWKCKATIWSRERIDGQGEGSFLTLCWFEEYLDAAPNELIHRALAHVNWQRRARPDLGL